MLLEFKIKNYKSFKDETIFSMVPATKIKELGYSILKSKIKNKTYKGLCSTIVYGPNASGKTNLIGAMDTFRAIVLRGNVKNDKIANANVASAKLELIPNVLLSETQPVYFAIKFITNDILVEYELAIDLGRFAEEKKRKIVAEKLTINDELVFNRQKRLDIGDFDVIKQYLGETFAENQATNADLATIARNNLNDEELFLVNGFKNIFSPVLASMIKNWFEDGLLIVYRADTVETRPLVSMLKQDQIMVNKRFNEAASLFGSVNKIGYTIDEERQPRLVSILDEHTAIPAEVFESYGTVRFTNMFPIITKTLKSGGVLCMDEFDASIHPMAIMSIINIFHDNEINTHNAQLIFNTHNPVFLNASLFRRDEIRFVDRDTDSQVSELYSLSSFSPAVRKTDDYMNHYFLSRYGAIRDVDFAPIFEELVRNGDNE